MDYKGHEIPAISHIIEGIDYRAELIRMQHGICKAYTYIDYIFSTIITGCGPKEYYLFEFFKLNFIGKRQYFTTKDRYLFEKKYNNTEIASIIRNKEKALMLFDEYIQRDWCGVEYHNTEEDYARFANSHDTAIIKPLNGFGGYCVRVVTLKEIPSLRDYCINNNVIVEELIEQHSQLNAMFSNAVNTIRLITIFGEPLAAALRLGVGDSNVDNICSGGLFAPIDMDNGIIISKARNYAGQEYTIHPTSGKIIPGFQIPYWDECIKLVKEANKKVNDCGIIGWDIAITENGPTIVELNDNPRLTINQAEMSHGLSNKIKEIVHEKCM